ncbi:MAG: DNA repair protein RadA [Candidatus Doudnabacteria bacterium]|nr:DNA repair protein RadA [Candidatus Doudnabacteria bacterium]
MPKSSVVFICSNCQYSSPRWQGKCPNCGQWNTLVESRVKISNSKHQISKAAEPVDLAMVDISQRAKIVSGISEFDDVLGGGFVPGSLVLLGGDPGIGKSTLALQISMRLGEKVLYVSGEESVHQIKLRSGRVSESQQLNVLAETDLDAVLASIEARSPELVVIDSIQTMYSQEASGVAGGVAQVTSAVQKIMRLAKQNHISFILIGHVTKEGYLAGPKTLEHMVDTVLYLEGERFASFRILRCVKNRFGTTNEVGVFEMQGQGLAEVKNPSQLFLGEEQMQASGNIITSVMEGSRALLLEIQALTSATNFGYPKRTTAGFDVNRLQLLTAILSKRAGLNLANQDIYINVVGGIKIDEPAADLAVALAIVSSLKEAVVADTIVVGELGLSGEVRYVPNLEKRIKEAEKLGFKKIICPRMRQGYDIKNAKIKILPVKTLQEAINLI